VVIGCNFLAENSKSRVAVPLAEIAQHLVVRAIFLNDVEYVLDGRPDSDVTRYHGRRRRSFGRHQLIVVVRRIVVHLFGPRRQVSLQLTEIDNLHAALLQALDRAVAFRTRWQRAARTANVGVRPHALAVSHIELSGANCQRGGVPAHGQKSKHFTFRALGDPYYGDIVVIGVGDEQHLVVAVERQRVRRGAFGRIRRQRGGDALDHLPRLRIDHRHRVVVGAGDEQAAILGKRHVIGIVADCDSPGDTQRIDIHEAYRIAAPVGNVQCLTVVAEHQRVRVHFHRDAL
jgi:hypothetical protein